MSSAEAKEAVSVFRELAKHPGLAKAQLVNIDDSYITVDSVWTQRSIEKNRWEDFARTYTLSKEDLKCLSVSSPHLLADSVWKVLSPSKNKTALVRKHVAKDDKTGDEKWFIEIWSQKGFCEKIFDVTSYEKHGPIYGNDKAFGSLSWSWQEDKIAYVAEKKKPKSRSYFVESKKKDDEKDEAIPGSKFLYKEDWGENLVDKVQPIVAVLDLEAETVEVVEDELLEESSSGQVVWCPDGSGLVFCAFPHGTQKLGMIYCPIRKSTLYHYDCQSKSLRSLGGGESLSVRAPRFSPDGSRLIYLECDAGGPHFKCMKLQMIDWPSGESKLVMDVTNSFSIDAEFLGIYAISLHQDCWHADSAHVFLTSLCRTNQSIYAINVTTGKVKRLSDLPGCWTIASVHPNYILASVSSVNTTPRLAIAKLDESKFDESPNWIYLEERKVISEVKWEVLQHIPRIPHPIYGSLIYESIILQPADGKSKGLVVLPHGGPHGNYPSLYALYYCFFVKLGFTLALVNYRGSVGYGEDSINSLLGNVGDNEIKDVQQCAEEVIEKYGLSKDHVVVKGGSHGGFITSHLIGQYPDFYKAAVVACGVTNIASMVGLTDIPDWCKVEVGCESASLSAPQTTEVLALMYSKSPIVYADKVRTPTLILVGQKDKRVPPSQSIEYHKALKANGVTTSLHLFPESNHCQDSVEVESEAMVNIYLWFINHLMA
ncbi:acylamino-acid-releasing enzyme-like [Watersipora subatra]|uniref:acylamino-acid-releasing enzyme-like n=1 Tax=Watersipora subatra TaxID=2589382 RepID=UPI00355C7842